ncbi:MAG: GntR family transcriptional regulator [Lachnospiraceae bacterium]|nr:GntR family transcriptional regulator [Lachnospiraceae bacterium]
MQRTDCFKKQAAYDAVKKMILDNELRAGMQLVERTLSERLEISRTPVREALRKLAGEGFVEIKEGKGVYVAQVYYEDIAEIFELRESLEGYASRLCVRRRTEESVEKLTGYLEAQEKAYRDGEHGTFMHIDMLMHNCIAEFSKNKRLIGMVSSVYDQVTRMAISVRDDPVIRDTAIRGHRALIRAIREGDEDGAEKAMREHIISTKEYHLEKYYLIRN